MRRSLAALAAFTLLLSTVGGASGAQPTGSPAPAPLIGPAPSEPTPSGVPGAPAEPAPSSPAPSAGASTSPAPTDPARVPSPGAATVGPGEPPTAPVVGPADAAEPAASSAPSDDANPKDRWIVVLKRGSDVTLTAERQGKRIGFKTDRTFSHAFRGYSARMDRTRLEALRHDPAVAMIVADERIETEAQTLPTGITRVNANLSPIARIDGIDERIDADVAIVDTGITRVADLNVAGGYNCSTSDRSQWRDVHGHGTHVAGTVGAIDNGSGVVGVAPGVRLWAVKILNDSGDGLLSWYVCGLDWIAAQRDPLDSTRPLFEAVNMSVAKWGADDRNCGNTNTDILHQAICRLVASGVTVVAAAGNDSTSATLRVPAAYDEVITVSALADTDGTAGGLGGDRCFSWGSYDVDDTFADFSNRGGDVDLIAPGKCIWSTIPGGYAYLSGTSMAAPHVTGAVALLKVGRPYLSPAEVREALQYLGTYNWKTWTDPDLQPDKLLDVSRIGARGDFSIATGPEVHVGETGGAASFPVTVSRTPSLFERIRFSVSGLPSGATAAFAPASLYGFEGVATTLTVTIPFGMAPGAFPITILADEHGNGHTTVATVTVTRDEPTAQAAVTIAARGQLTSTTFPTVIAWPPATDPSTPISGYEVAASVDGGAWGPATATGPNTRSVPRIHVLGHRYQYQVRARDGVGSWSPWVAGPTATAGLIQDRDAAVSYTGRWTRSAASWASGGTVTWSTAKDAIARTTFSGRGVAIVAPIGPTRGSAWIYMDGVFSASVNLRASTGAGRVVLWERTFSSVAIHRIGIRLLGNGRVDLDAFVILR